MTASPRADIAFGCHKQSMLAKRGDFRFVLEI